MARLFPGVDPYVEAQGYWPDFHARTITYCCDVLAEGLPEAYLAQIEERIHLVERPAGDLRLMRPDLALERSPGFSTAGGGPAVLEVEPTTVPVLLLEEVRETYIEILHRPERTLVTVVELPSPANKSAPGSGQYLAERDALLRSPAHLVELDFLVGGQRLPMARPLPPGDVYAFVARGDRRPDCEVYAWSIRQPFSAIRIPLLAPDPDITLDLGSLYATTFERGRYARAIRYGSPLTIGLSPDDRAWAEAKAKGLDR